MGTYRVILLTFLCPRVEVERGFYILSPLELTPSLVLHVHQALSLLLLQLLIVFFHILYEHNPTFVVI